MCPALDLQRQVTPALPLPLSERKVGGISHSTTTTPATLTADGDLWCTRRQQGLREREGAQCPERNTEASSHGEGRTAQRSGVLQAEPCRRRSQLGKDPEAQALGQTLEQEAETACPGREGGVRVWHCGPCTEGLAQVRFFAWGAGHRGREQHQAGWCPCTWARLLLGDGPRQGWTKLGFWLSLTLLGETEQEQSWEPRGGSELHSVPVSSTGQ